MLQKEITVRLVSPSSEFSRRPTAHTCGCVLEIPNDYSTYVELRNDFNAVLNADIWTMDMI
jgi:hypothetical protein